MTATQPLVAGVLWLLAEGVSGGAGGGQPLALDQAIHQAIDHNPDLRRERITVDVARARQQAALGPFDLRLHSTALVSRRTTPALTADDLQAGSMSALTLDLGLARNLESGGELRVALRDTSSSTNQRLACGSLETIRTSCAFHESELVLGLTQPLLRGFGSVVAQAELRRSRILTDQALLNRQMRAANVVRDVINTYWELAYATQDLAIRQSAVELAREQLRLTRAQIDAGRLATLDSASVERAISEQLQEVVLAEEAVLAGSLALRRLLGASVDAAFTPYLASQLPAPSHAQTSVAVELARALEANPQLRALRMGKALSDINLQTARSTLWPQLDFVGSVGAAGRRDGLRPALAESFGLRDVAWSVGLNFTMPLQNRAATGQLGEARLAADRVRLDADDLEQELRAQVVRLVSQLSACERRMELARAAVGYASLGLKAEKLRFAAGRSSVSDTLLRQQELKAAETHALRASINLLQNQTTLAALTGTLLEEHGVGLSGP